MPLFAANLSMLWPELGPYDRFAAASAAGFAYVEMLFPHELDADRLEGTLDRYDLKMVSFDPAPGDWAAGERGLLTLPGREMEFLHGVREAIKLAGKIGTTRLNTLVGIPPAGVSHEVARATAVANLTMAAPLAAEAGVTLLVEGINTIDIPGYWAGSVAAAVALVEAVGHPNVCLQLDQYHAGMAGEDAIECLHAHLPLVAHVQIADVPGRHEPGTGTQPIEQFLDDLDRVGYDGYVGLEYRPLVDTATSLRWLKAYRAQRA
jgi:hydroxypyruvate isomerase